jgi:sortase (surface protein transpeptidase)
MRVFRLLVVVGALVLVACGPKFDVDPVPGPEGADMAAQQSGPSGEAADPTELEIPAIDVRTPLTDLGLHDDRTVEVPDDAHVAGWYTGGPRPGEIGPAAVIGHVDSHDGPGVFYRLAELEPGDTVRVGQSDGAEATFVVRAVEQYPKAAEEFPTERVYGDTEGPELRLITCGGVFDESERSYRDNIVVFAAAAS